MPTIYTARKPPKDSWTALSQLLAEAASRGLEARVALAPSDPASRKSRTKRAHDLKGALRTLKFTVEALQTGYRFDDERAEAKVEAIARAVRTLEGESPVWLDLLEPEGP